ncbi:OmpA family protein [Photobacterium halotolerans]|uniref:OmpA-like domain-containing protein n=1 Tax=Photobacterium halotolerans TaxID=265726 RepID=A0A0F5V6P4_9GAMM|nr:OmpA family protein [Photobacterium halotolerans]KKC97833.1 hypothetical protein KY46_21770 [Photobacterium halotolerans]KKC97860.1 hypothetical protein KY46_21605 [Photobacterium halotolerans]KKD00199.1 hypothetical protein KY46_07940 [Photobacterium halotolerans]
MKFSDNILDYGIVTLTASGNKVEALYQNDSLTEDEHNIIKALKNTLKKMSVNDAEGSHYTASDIVDGEMYRIDSTTFGFDRATPNFADQAVVLAFKEIGTYLTKLTDPIDIVITGHTCDIGREKYNLELSRERADSVKNCILEAIKEIDKSLVQLWEPRIVTNGYGEHNNLVPNDSEENRSKNRRVEIVLKFSSQFDYPPCRTEIIQVEKSRKAAIVSLMDLDKSIGATIENAFDLIVGIAATLAVPYAGWLLLAKNAEGFVSTAYQEFEKKFNEDSYKAGEILKLLSHVDISIANKIFDESGLSKHQIVLVKSYLKRSLALNGLIRLIKRNQYSKFNGTMKQSFKDLDVEGYINNFILRDDQLLDDSLFGSVHLDEVWLNLKDIDGVDDYWSFNLAHMTAYSRLIFNKSTVSKQGKFILNEARSHNKYFPVHYFAANSVEQFESTFGFELPTNLDKSIFKSVIISAKEPGSDDWEEFYTYYKNKRDEKLSPFDNIRVLVIVDTNKIKLDKSDLSNLPIELKAKSIEHSQVSSVATPSLEKTASANVAFVKKIDKNDLTNYEISSVSDDEVWGVIIEPSFFYGLHQIHGTRPLVSYNNSRMQQLFSDEYKDQKYKPRRVGTEFVLSYFYQLSVPGQEKTEQEVYYTNHKKYKNFKVSKFSLSLNPNREYKFYNKDKSSKSNLIKTDHIFYERGFLENKSEGKSTTFVRVFDEPVVDIYIGQPGNNLKYKEVSDINREEPLPEFLSSRRFRGELNNFDWNNSVLLTVIVRSKTVQGSKEQLKNQKYDPNCVVLGKRSLNVDKMLIFNGYEFEMDEISCLYRVGELIVDESGEMKFISSEYPDDSMRDGILGIQKKYENFSPNELKKFAVKDFWGMPEPTEIWANSASLKYTNAVGTECSGLTPMLYPADYNMDDEIETYHEKELFHVKFFVTLNGPTDSGLSNATSNVIRLNGKPRTTPSNWYKLDDDKKFKYALEQVKTNNRVRERSKDEAMYASQANVNKYGVKVHNNEPIIEWVSANPENYNEINEKRKKLIVEWLNS